MDGSGVGGGTSYSSESQGLSSSSDFTLDHVGEVTLSTNSHTLFWKSPESPDTDGSTCFGRRSTMVSAEIEFADIYAVEFIDDGLVHELNSSDAARGLLAHSCPIYSFAVHGFRRSKTQPSLWVLVTYTFRHKDMQTCQMWLNHISAALDKEAARPKNLLVFVHPKSGKGSGCQTWESVAPIFGRAKVNTKVIVTQRAGHAFDVMVGITNDELGLYDGVIAVGGDGFFNEILNGLLSSRYSAPYPPAPTDFLESLRNDDNSFHSNSKQMVAEITHQNGHQSPQFSSRDSGLSDEETEFLLLIQRLRFGIIPAGSTDAIVICTTGARDPVTSALHIVLGKRVPLDIAQIVRWRTKSTSKVEPCVRYAASFAGYGFYGDVITESEKYRWMGPKRYDYAGTKVFLRHRSYEAEVAYLEVKSEEQCPERCRQGGLSQALWGSNKRQRVICRANCDVCNAKPAIDPRSTLHSYQGDANWLRCKGHFLSVGAAIIACRNERSPDGLVADAHLADGLIHLILIKDCPRAFYLWHLMQLAKKNGDPLRFDFVEYHKTMAFTFKSSGKSSMWNLDGELFEAHQLSAQVFRGLVCLFAAGPQV